MPLQMILFEKPQQYKHQTKIIENLILLLSTILAISIRVGS